MKFGGGLAITASFIPSNKNRLPVGIPRGGSGLLMTSLWNFGFLDHEAKRETEVRVGGCSERQKHRRTNGESRSVRPQKQNPEKETAL